MKPVLTAGWEGIADEIYWCPDEHEEESGRITLATSNGDIDENVPEEENAHQQHSRTANLISSQSRTGTPIVPNPNTVDNTKGMPERPRNRDVPRGKKTVPEHDQ